MAFGFQPDRSRTPPLRRQMTPRGTIGRFLNTMATTWQLPEARLRPSVVGTGVIALAGVVASAWMLRPALGLGDDYPLKAGGVFAFTMLVAAGAVHGAHPFDRFGLANQITTARAAIVALIVGLLFEPAQHTWMTTAAVAGLGVTALDGVDGWAARRSGMASTFGARFDMEVDALLILALSGLAWQTGKAGAWIVLAGLLRYLFVVGMWTMPWMNRPLPHSQRRRAVCAVQVAGLSLIMLPMVGPPTSTWFCAGLLALLSYSFAVDTAWLWRHRG